MSLELAMQQMALSSIKNFGIANANAQCEWTLSWVYTFATRSLLLENKPLVLVHCFISLCSLNGNLMGT